jgi:hypothetical protein
MCNGQIFARLGNIREYSLTDGPSTVVMRLTVFVTRRQAPDAAVQRLTLV